MPRLINYTILYETLGYTFKNFRLLQRALTRRSAVVEDQLGEHTGHNERLEFFGDSILDTVIDDILLFLYPKYSEGELTKKRNEFVSNDYLTTIAEKFNIEPFIVMGNGDRKNCKKSRKKKFLADTLEALIAAIFIDSRRNYQIVKKCVMKLLDFQSIFDDYLFQAVRQKNAAFVYSLLNHGADPNAVKYWCYPCPGSYARGHLYRAEIDDIPEWEGTHIFEEIYGPYTEAYEDFISVLELAISIFSSDYQLGLEIVEILLDADADLNKRYDYDYDKSTILHKLFKNKPGFYVPEVMCISLVDILLRHGANTELVDCYGKFPRDYTENPEIKRLLSPNSDNTPFSKISRASFFQSCDIDPSSHAFNTDNQAIFSGCSIS